MSEEMPLVVVGVDGSEHGDAALRRALREASGSEGGSRSSRPGNVAV